jgi:hypothetical protein
VTLFYETRGFSAGDAFVILVGEKSRLIHQALPETGGFWKRFDTTVSPDDNAIEGYRIILRNWGNGEVWFDDVSIREVR